MESLKNYISNNEDDATVSLPPDSATTKTNQLLSYAQRSIFEAAESDAGLAYENNCRCYRLAGSLNKLALVKAVKTIIGRHGCLHSNFFEKNGEIQLVQNNDSGELFDFKDITHLSEDQQSAEIETTIASEAMRSFDLSDELLMHAVLLKLADSECVFLLTVHPIISDDKSLDIFAYELGSLYQAYSEGVDNPLTPLPMLYSDYVRLQHNWLQGKQAQVQLHYWQQQLKELPPVHSLPLDHARANQSELVGRAQVELFNENLTDSVMDFCAEQGVTLLTFLHAMFAVLIYRYSNENDIVIGTPISGRNSDNTEGLIGLFAQWLVLRSQLNHQCSFAEHLMSSKQIISDAFSHQQIPFEMLAKQLAAEQSTKHHPLFQVAISLQNNTSTELVLGELDVSAVAQLYNTNKFDLELKIAESKGRLVLAWNYNAGLFELASIKRMASSYQLMIEAVLEDAGRSIGDLPLLSEQQQQRLRSWNDTARELPSDQGIHELFERQAELSPDATAVICGEVKLSYTELERGSNQLAHYLRSLGVGPEVRVGVCLGRDQQLPLVLLAILKSGGAYVPLDPEYPEERLSYMLSDSGASFLLTSADLEVYGALSSSDVKVLDVEGLELSNYSTVRLGGQLLGDQLAYVIYTSGSTGQPKGVCIRHSSAVAMLSWATEEYGKKGLRGVLASTSICFDLSVYELFAPLCVGGQVVIASNALSLLDFEQWEQVSLVNTVPSAIEALLSVRELPAGIEVVNLAGEALSSQTVEKVYQRSEIERLYNLYGPSEDTTYSTGCWVHRGAVDSPSIGSPISNSQAYVLDAGLNQVPVGVAGELYMGGAGLSRGYIGQGGLTADRFVPNPHAGEGKRIYRTGDLARYREDGSIEYVGRIDHQVKLRGFRIELGEIESRLEQQPGVESALVQVLDSELGQQLVGYVISDGDLCETELKVVLRAVLPAYMVPLAIVQLDAYPLTANGKVDRQALVEPDWSLYRQSYMAPRDDREQVLAEIYASLLPVDQVGIEDNFFELGGQSLLATQLTHKIKKQLAIDLPLQAIFDQPTVSGLSSILDAYANIEPVTAIKPAKQNDDQMLSYSQRWLWFVDQLDGGSSQYNIPTAFRLAGELNTTALIRSLKTIVSRHEVLRSSFKQAGDKVFPYVHNSNDFEIQQLDFSSFAIENQNSELEQLINNQAYQDFDLAKDMPIRIQLIKLSAEDHALLITIHHIATDGLSMGVYFDELGILYSAYMQEHSNPLPSLAVQYSDYARWQSNWLNAANKQKLLDYWEHQLADIDPYNGLPIDKPRPEKTNHFGSVRNQRLGSALSSKIKAYCAEHSLTRFMLLQTAFAILLSRYTNKTDVLMGTTMAGRRHSDTESLIGFFANTVVLRTQFDINESFSYILTVNKEALLDAQSNQEFPFELLVEALAPTRSLNYSPIIQIMFTMVEGRGNRFELPDINTGPLSKQDNTLNYDLRLSVHKDDNIINLDWVYNHDIFDAGTIERLSENFQILLDNALSNPEKPLRNIPYLTDQEKSRLLVGPENLTTDFSESKSIKELFEAQVERTPEAISLVYQQQQLTYHTVNAQANYIAHYLVDHGVKPDTLVGLCVEPGLEMVIGILAIIKAGGAYVPIDPANPEQRIAYILDDAELGIVLTQSNISERLPVNDQLILCLDSDDVQTQLQRYSSKNPITSDIDLKPENLAYVIYTSGSTGQPKGVLVEHRNISHFQEVFTQQLHHLGVTDESTWLWSSSYAFDASVKGILALNHGRKVVIASQAKRNDAAQLGCLLLDNHVSVFNGMPQLVEQVMDSLQTASDEGVHLIVGGDEIRPGLWQKIGKYCDSRSCRAINAYGPTELTINASYAQIGSNTSVSIGKPVLNSKAYVLNDDQQLVPIGVPGELFVGGNGVARGYWNRDDLTDARFIPNVFSKQSNERLYRTGDQVRWTNDGDLEFLGRSDNQVKIRGFRIELGEIEAQLLKLTRVNQAHVLVNDSEIGEKQLVAYLVLDQQAGDLQPDQIKIELKKNLPDYMLPTAWLVVNEIPLTSSGKIDRKALLELGENNAVASNLVAPRSAIEEKLCGIWQATLELDQISIEDDFFELGGYSLLAMKLINLVREELNAELDLQDIFEHSDVASMAKVLESKTEPVLQPIAPVKREGNLQASYGQERLWFIDKLKGDSKQYNITAVFNLAGKINRAIFKKSLYEVVQRHEILRSNFIEQAGAVFSIIKNVNSEIFEVLDLTLDDESQKSIKAQTAIQAEAERAFNLSEDSLLRVRLIALSDDEHSLIITIHHIISDGWSMGVLYRDLSVLYAAYSQNKANPLLPLPIQYADFSTWQSNWLQVAKLEEQLGYWKKQLAGIPAVHSVPLDYPRTEDGNTIGAIYRQHIDEKLSDELKQLCAEHDVTLFMLLETAFAVLLSWYSGKNDIVIGTPMSGRINVETESLIGFFANAVALRSNIDHKETFLALLKQNKEIILNADKYQYIQFETLVEALQQGRSLHYNPIIQIMFTLFNEPQGELSLPGLKITKIHSETDGLTNFDLRALAVIDGSGIRLDWIYNIDIFSPETIARMSDNYCSLLRNIADSPASPIQQIPYLCEAENDQLLVEWNDGGAGDIKNIRLHELFESQVIRTPDSVALVVDNQQLSYRMLNRKANQLADYLLEQGVTLDTLVGLCVTPSPEMVIGILGIIKAGGAYLPLDPAYPVQRLQFILDDADVEIVLTQSDVLDKLPVSGQQTLCLDTSSTQAKLEKYNTDNPIVKKLGLTGQNLLYVIYTSGSTGQPKGVQVEHRNLCNFQTVFEQQIDYLEVADNSPWLWNAAYVFDASLKGIAALNMGKRVVIATQTQRTDVNQLGALVLSQNIPVFNGMPQLVEHMLDYLETHSDRAIHLIASGDELSQRLWNRIAAYCQQRGCRAINAYGPTELTVNATFAEILPTVRSNIGKPVFNSSVYVLDEQQNLLPIGAVGELYVGGEGLARGYLKQQTLTEQSFIPNPFCDQDNERIYRTGDRVRWLVDGQLEFLGRNDQQIKIHGFRIELGEIESCLLQQSTVKQAKVLVRKSESGEKQLVAYLVLNKDQDSQAIQHIQDAIKQKLPDYMLPVKWLQLDVFPLMVNGKLDSSALLALADEQTDQQGYLAPRTELEQKLCEIWQTTLEVDRIGIEDDFFDLGGYSLLAMVLINMIREELNVEIDLQDVFEHPNIASLAETLQFDTEEVLPSIKVLESDDALQLSYAQQRLWFIDNLEGGSSQYNIPFAFRLTGVLDVDALTRSLEGIIKRHEVLRSDLIQSGEQVHQYIRDEFNLNLKTTDLADLPADEQAAEISRLVAAEAYQTFDLSTDLKLRAQLLHISGTEHVLMMTMHHIASDGWSTGVLFHELSELYQAYCQGQAKILPSLAVQYADYAQWQRDWLSGDVLEQQLNYWREQLTDIPPVHSLPLDYARPNEQSFIGKTHRQELDSSLTEKLKQIAQRHDVTLFMLMQTIFAVLLNRYSNESDIVVGTPIAGRTHADTEGLIGFFVNTLALRSRFEDNPKFTELLAANKQTILDAYTHQHIPFEMLVEELRPERSLQHSPVFQVLFILQNHEKRSPNLPNLTSSRITREHTIIKFDLELLAITDNDKLILNWDYNTDLFESSSIKRLAASYRVLLDAIIADANLPVSELPILSQQQQLQFLSWNDTSTELPVAQGVHELFEHHAELNPESIAVVMGDQVFDYSQLNEQANQLAHYLLSQGIKIEQRVAVCMNRCPQLLVALLGIMKAGAAYVPLDPEYPTERLSYMAQDAKVHLLLTAGDIGIAGQLGVQVLNLDKLGSVLSKCSNINPGLVISSENLAYVIYTSGSTGQPKGVLNSHRGLLNLIGWHIQAHAVTPAHRGSWLASIGFDASTWEVWPYLSAGASLWAVSDQQRTEPERLLAGLDEYQVSHSFMPTPLAESLTGYQWPKQMALEVLLVGGDKLNGYCLPADMEVRLVNHYGPTETAVVGTCGEVQKSVGAIPTIGRPISNVQAYVVDQLLEQLPIGVSGELCLSGRSVARGYMHRPALTASVFMPDPCASEPGARLYRTGDLVRYREDGEIEFLGRIDHQVKLRGFRVELGEIESKLEQQSDVDSALVQVLDGDLGQQLVGYVVSHCDVCEQQLKEALQQVLPAYMVPLVIMQLESFPLTANGKVDRKALPVPDWEAYRQQYVAPRDEVESQLVEIYQSLLPVDQVGIDDNFFELGGDSIISIQLVSRARQFGLGLSVRDVFTHQTVRQLSLVAERSEASDAEQGLVTGEVGLTPIQSWFAAGDYVNAHHWNQAMLFKLPGEVDKELLEQLLTGLVNHHDALRLYYPDSDWNSQSLAGAVEQLTLRYENLSDSEDAPSEIDRIGSEVQGSLDLESGCLLAGCLFVLPDGSHRLLLAIHHLGVDGVSWRILQEDLRLGYAQLQVEEALSLPGKSYSYQAWSSHLQDQVKTESLSGELAYWQDQAARVESLYVEHEGSNLVGDSKAQRVSLSKSQTEQLLKQVNAAYRTQIDDVLLTALLLGYREWTGRGGLSLHLEGHGRELVGEELDITRTVGWFTSIYPVTLVGTAGDLGEQLMGVKEQLRSIPNKGVGYGLLRYLHSDAQVRTSLQPAAPVELSFNYLGQFQASTGLFDLASESTGSGFASDQQRIDKLSVLGRIRNGQLQLICNYSEQCYSELSIQTLMSVYLEQLQVLISHCVEPGAIGRTPSDYPLCQLSQSQLDDLRAWQDDENGEGIESIYPLSSVQQGMLFHSEAEAGAGHYLVQKGLDLKNLDAPAYRRAWERLLASHGVLRTVFWGLEGEQPQQLIPATSELPWQEYDWSGLSDEQRTERWRQLMNSDRERGYAAASGPLMRCYLVSEGQGSYRFLWSYHHALLDGWSMPLVMRDLRRIYQGELRNAPVEIRPEAQYADYIGWLISQDRAEAEGFWREHLVGIQAPTTLPFEESFVGQPIVKQARVRAQLGKQQTERLQLFAQHHHLTLNTLLQSVWGLLLSRYNGESEVVFGTTVSGRPPQLEGVGEIVGPFISTLPVRLNVDENQSVLAYLEGFQGQHLQRERYGYLPLLEIQQCSEVLSGLPLFESLVVYENYPTTRLSEQLSSNAGSELQMISRSAEEQTHYPITLVMSLQQNQLWMGMSYDVNRFNEAMIEQLLGHFQQLLSELPDDVDQSLERLSLLTPQEQLKLRQNDGREVWIPFAERKPADCLQHRFEALVELRPQAIAVWADGDSLSYQQLNEHANQLAYELLSSGLQPEALVAVYQPDGVMRVISQLAILKAGAAYLLLDEIVDEEHLHTLLELSELVLTTEATGKPSVLNGQTLLCVNAVEVSQRLQDHPVCNPKGIAAAGHYLACVMWLTDEQDQLQLIEIEHLQILELLSDSAYPAMSAHTSLVSMGTGSPEAISFALWGVLLGGGCYQHQATAEQESTTGDIETLLLSMPEFDRLAEQAPLMFAGVKQLILTSGQIDGELLGPLLERGQSVMHVSGPSSQTARSRWHKIDRISPRGIYPVSINSQLTREQWHTSVYVLDKRLRLLPAGVVGEVYYGGRWLGRDRSLTDKELIASPWGAAEQLVKSGKWARWHSDNGGEGYLEQVERLEGQVIIRGQRIRVVEVVDQLNDLEQISESAVLVQLDQQGQSRLVAYVVPVNSDWKAEALLGAIQVSLKDRLSANKLPSLFVFVEGLPRDDSGELDESLLPSAQTHGLVVETYVAPRNEVERHLVDICEDLLPVDRVGIDDNFFELGGDSIISIQLVSRACQAGLGLTVRDVFTHQTVRALSTVAEHGQVSDAEQGLVVGKVGLTPVQSWFAEAEHSNAHHWNQAMLFKLPAEVDKGSLEQLLTTLVNHHDALRLYYPEGDWASQALAGTVEGLSLRYEDLNNSEDVLGEIDRIGSEVQASLDLESGCLLAGCLFVLPDASNRLLLAVHHLGVDVVSWRILQDDLRLGYGQIQDGQALSLPSKSHSFQSWSDHISGSVESGLLDGELEYWREQTGRVERVYVERAGSNLVADSKERSASLSDAQTEQLLKQVNTAYRTQIDDVLLTALMLGYREWTGRESLSLHLEGHGRERVGEELDITRTVGWFTSIYPVTLGSAAGGLGEQLMGVKEQLRSIPNKGIGYGLLRYLHPDADFRTSLKPAEPVEISFNYLGQFQGQQDDELFALGNEGVGESVSRDLQRNHKLSLIGRVREGRLQLSCSYSGGCYSDKVIDAFLSAYVNQLEALIDHCMEPGALGRTPSDYPLCQLNQNQLDDLRAWQDDENGEGIESIYPLSSVQQGMLFHSEAEAGAGHYLVQKGLDLKNLDAPAYRRAWERLLASHGVLRTVFWGLEGEQPQQLIPATSELPWQEYDWSGLSDEQRTERWRQLMNSDRERGYAAASGPLMRCYLVSEGQGSYRFLWSYHHALLDGWSMPLVMRDLRRIYQGELRNAPVEIRPEAQYADYIGWLISQDRAEAEDFWREHLVGIEAATPLVFGELQTNTAMENQTHIRSSITPAQSERLQAFAQKRHLTLNTLLQSMWGLLLSRYSGESDVVFGTTVSGRPAELEGVGEIIGPFISTLPVRVSVDGSQSVLGYLENFQDQHLQRERYGYLPLVEIQQCSQVTAGVQLFETLVVYENYPTAQLTEEERADGDAGLQVTGRSGEEQTHYPMALMMAMHQGCLNFWFYYDTDRFHKPMMERLLGHYQQLLDDLVRDDERQLSQLNLLTGQERQMLLDWNTTVINLPDAQGVHELFERQAELTPDATAVAMDGNSLSYVQLNQEANRLAQYLGAQGIGPGHYIGVCMDRRIELMVTFMGILKSGAAYVPMDPGYPLKRLSYMLKDTGISQLITAGQLDVVDQLVDESIEVVNLDEVAQAISSCAADKLQVNNDPRNLAYVIYTSGSTGEPKGVEVQHSGVINFLSSMLGQLGFDGSDRFLGIGPISFDTHVLEFYLPLTCGAQIIICDGPTSKDGAALGKAVWDNDISVLQATPATWQLITANSDVRFKSGLKAMAGGESFGPELADRVLSLADSFWNVYGPTEMTVYSSWKSLERGSELITVGRPIDNAHIYILDGGLELLPVGVVGEICISGKGMVRGYLNKPGLTATAYVPNPFSDEPGQRLYRSGDLGRFTSEGEIEYVGRIDHQVKVRGFRIELGEVESRLQEQPGIQEALAHVVENDQGQQLVGYVLSDEQFCESQLKSSLRQTLPPHMVPAAILRMEAFPLTVNGKVNRKALPNPDWEAYRKEYVAPRNETEQQLAEIYQSLLSLEQIGIDDNFFELGGHSLLATQLINKARQQLNVELPLRALFDNPVIRSLVEVLKQYQGKETMPIITKAQKASVREEQEWEGEQF